jgi:hypothetical protein
MVPKDPLHVLGLLPYVRRASLPLLLAFSFHRFDTFQEIDDNTIPC